jgi:hypothetical protein
MWCFRQRPVAIETGWPWNETPDGQRVIIDPAVRRILITASRFLLDLGAGLGYSHTTISHTVHTDHPGPMIDSIRPTRTTGEEADALPQLWV